MIFTSDEILKLKLFCQSVIMRPLPIDKQEAVIKNGSVWCADWWTIEILKCLFLGADVYRLDPKPRRLKNNTIWDQEYIIKEVEWKIKMLKALREHANFSDTLLLCEVGRGTDILLANFVKEWRSIRCYDTCEGVLNEINIYFKDKMGLPMNAYIMNTGTVVFNDIDDKIILIANATRLGEKNKDILRAKKNILAIVDGEILKEPEYAPRQ